MRIKRRYITTEIVGAKATFSKAMIEESILDAVEKIHGVFGVAAASSFTVKYWNSVTSIALLRVCFGPHKLISTVLPFVNSMGGETVQINTIFVGATLKQCYINIQKYQMGKLEKLWWNLRTTEERRNFQRHFIDANITKHLKEKTRSGGI